MSPNESFEQRIRLLVTEIAESAPPAPILPEGDTSEAAMRSPSVRRPVRHLVPLLTVPVAIAVLLVGLTFVVTRTPDSKHVSKPNASHSPWRLVSDLQGSPFLVATGSPQGVVGATCGVPSTCFLSTGYSLDISGGGSLYVSHDGGAAWALAGLPDTTAIETLASCGSVTWCVVGGGVLDAKTGDPAAKKPMRDPILLITRDQGVTWSQVPVPIPVNVQQLPAYGNLPAETTYWPGEIDSVSCGSPGQCNVVGHTQVDAPNGGLADEIVFLRTVDGGVHWATAVLPERASERSFQVVTTSGESVTMDCASTLTCVVVGHLFQVFSPQGGTVDAWRTTDGGTTWAESPIEGVAVDTASGPLSCPTTSECWLVPQGQMEGQLGHPAPKTILESTDGGASWRSVVTPALGPPADPNGYGWNSISCPTASQCFVAGSLSEPINAGTPCTISGPISDTCYREAALVAETTDGGKSWIPVALPPNVGPVANVSCTRGSDATCLAVASFPNSSGQGSLVLTNRSVSPDR